MDLPEFLHIGWSNGWWFTAVFGLVNLSFIVKYPRKGFVLHGLAALIRSISKRLPAIFGHHLKENVFYPVPHRQYVFSISIMLWIYFKHNRSLLTGLCRCAYKSLLVFLQQTVRLKDGIPGVVMAIHTFGEYPEKFHLHVHAYRD